MELIQSSAPQLTAELMDIFETSDLQEIERRILERDYPSDIRHILEEVRSIVVDALAVSVPVQRVPIQSTRNPSISNTRPINDHNPYSYLTTLMLEIISEKMSIQPIPTNRDEIIRVLSGLGPTWYHMELSHEEYIRLSPMDQTVYTTYQAGRRRIDFTRAPYGYLDIRGVRELMTIILYRLVDEAPGPILYLAVKHLYPKVIAEAYDRQQLIDAIRGSPPAPDPVLRRRYQHLASLPGGIVDIYASTHDKREPGLMWELVQATPSPLEPYIDRVTGEQGAREVSEALGMVIPPDRGILFYVRNNIGKYGLAVAYPPTFETDQLLRVQWTGNERDLSELLSRYTDQDLFDLLGVYVYYTSRVTLILSLTNLMTGSTMFFIPLNPCPNSETYYGTLTRGVPLVAYGTLRDYRCYEEEEFLANIREFPFSIKIPGTQTVLSKKEIEVLRDTISRFTFPRLSEKIRVGLLQASDPTLRVPFQHLTPVERDSVKNFLLAMFRTGMYMRQWTGSGCYPVTKASTLTDIDPEPRSLQGLIELNSIYEDSSPATRFFLDSLRMRASNGFYGYTFMERFHIVLQGNSTDTNSCIRINSSKFILTAYYYLEQLFSYRIPDFSPSTLELIS